MIYVLTPEQMRIADETAIKKIGISGSILMENAAVSSAAIIEFELLENELFDPEILVLCGSGNNGGDGFAIARHLSNKGYFVDIYLIGSVSKMSQETLANYNICEKMGFNIINISNEKQLDKLRFDYDVIIDSMIGVGGSENLRGIVIPILKKVNEQISYRIAIDVPTGLNSDSGFSHPDCFNADLTTTMFAVKSGMFRNDGLNKCGIINIADLGAPPSIVENISEISILEDDDIDQLINPRKLISSKFDYGRVTVIAGSMNMPGAAALVSNSAITAGAGLVHLLSNNIHPSLLPEIMPYKVDSTSEGTISYKSYDIIKRFAEKSDVIAIGPGLGESEETFDLIRRLISDFKESKTIIIDADGIKALNMKSKLSKNIIITPHTGELALLTGISRAEIEADTNSAAIETAKELSCTVHLKHVPSVTTNGRHSYWNIYGNPGMATAGSGDVLTGIIAGLSAQNIDPMYSAAIGSYYHSKASDYFVSKYSETTLTATEIRRNLKNVIT